MIRLEQASGLIREVEKKKWLIKLNFTYTPAVETTAYTFSKKLHFFITTYLFVLT